MQQRDTWLLKSWFCKWKCSATGDLWNLCFVQSEKLNDSTYYELLDHDPTEERRSDTVIKPADKGSAVVVMDRHRYVSEEERQLNDSTRNELLDHDPTDEFAKKVSETVEEMFDDGYITEKNMRYSRQYQL